MSDFKLIPVGNKRSADFAVRLEDDAMAPYLKAGQIVYLRRSAELCDGDVGLFFSRGGMVFRQFCRDSRGTAYLFALDRTKKREDLSFPPGAELPVCFGKVLLSRPPELPMD